MFKGNPCCCPYFYYCSMQRKPIYRPYSKESKKYTRQKQFTLEELAQYDGSSGKPAYVAVDGVVYDVSVNGAWGGGTHFGLYAGKDLTAQFGGCHSGSSILERLPRVGVLIGLEEQV